jgi:hypothetical protein
MIQSTEKHTKICHSIVRCQTHFTIYHRLHDLFQERSQSLVPMTHFFIITHDTNNYIQL